MLPEPREMKRKYLLGSSSPPGVPSPNRGGVFTVILPRPLVPIAYVILVPHPLSLLSLLSLLSPYYYYYYQWLFSSLLLPQASHVFLCFLSNVPLVLLTLFLILWPYTVSLFPPFSKCHTLTSSPLPPWPHMTSYIFLKQFFLFFITKVGLKKTFWKWSSNSISFFFSLSSFSLFLSFNISLDFKWTKLVCLFSCLFFHYFFTLLFTRTLFMIFSIY